MQLENASAPIAHFANFLLGIPPAKPVRPVGQQSAIHFCFEHEAQVWEDAEDQADETNEGEAA